MVTSLIGILLTLVYRMVAYVTGIVSVNRTASNLQLVDLILYIYNNTQNPETDTLVKASTKSWLVILHFTIATVQSSWYSPKWLNTMLQYSRVALLTGFCPVLTCRSWWRCWRELVPTCACIPLHRWDLQHTHSQTGPAHTLTTISCMPVMGKSQIKSQIIMSTKWQQFQSL